MAYCPIAASETCLRHHRSRDAVALAILVVVAFGLRLWRLGEPSFWTDEAYTALVYTLPPGRMLARLVVDDLHPPLYPLFIGLWASLVGTGELALRLPSVLFGVATVPAVVLLAGRLFPGRVGRLAGWIAAALTALSPLLLLHSQEARNTTLVALAATLATWALASALDPPETGRWLRDSALAEVTRRTSRATSMPAAGRWLRYGALALALIYTHDVGAFVLVAHAAFVLLRGQRRALAAFARTMAVIGLLYLPWLPSAWHQATQYRTYLPSTFSLPTVLAELLSSYVSGVIAIDALRANLGAIGLGLAGLLLLGLVVAPRAWRGVLLLVLVIALPVGAMLVIWSQTPKINPRYLVVVAPSVYVVLGWSLAALATAPRPAARPVLALLAAAGTIGALALSAWGLPGSYAAEKDDYRALVAEIERRAGPNDAIVTLMELDEPVRYYYRGTLPIYHILAQGPFAETAATLDAALAGRSAVWLVTFGGAWADPSGFVGHSLAEHARARLYEHWYGTTSLVGYRLESERPFTAEPTPAHPARIRFANGVEFLGWDLVGAGAVVAGQEATVDWHWRPTRADTPDFKVVMAVEDATGRELARLDRTPATLLWNPPRWRLGETVHGQDRLSVPATTPPGPYRARITIYDPITLKEIPALTDDGKPTDPRVDVGTVDVEPAAEPVPDQAIGIPRLAAPIDFASADGPVMRLVGAEVTPADPREGGGVQIGLAWRALAKPSADLEVVVQVRADGRVVDEVAFPPVATYPTSRWAAGSLFVARHELLLPPDVPGGALELAVALRPVAGTAPLAVVGGGTAAPVATLQVRARPASRAIPSMQHPIDARLGDAVRLLGYDLSLDDARPGGSVRLTLDWQALARVPRRLKVFTHLVDDRDRFIGQQDAEPRGGELPTVEWKSGEVVTDLHVIPIRPDAEPGRYQIKVGLYDAASGQRVPVVGADAGSSGTFVALGPIEVRR